MLPGTSSARALCHPAWSMISTIRSPGSTSRDSTLRNAFIVPVLTCGASSAELNPAAGSTAA